MPRIYVGTYAKYAAGSIKGEWLDLEDYTRKDEFITACLELHADEDDPELMFQDHEGVPSCFITKCSIDEGFWDYMECNADDGAKEAYCEVFGEWNGDATLPILPLRLTALNCRVSLSCQSPARRRP